MPLLDHVEVHSPVLSAYRFGGAEGDRHGDARTQTSSCAWPPSASRQQDILAYSAFTWKFSSGRNPRTHGNVDGRGIETLVGEGQGHASQ